MPTEIIKKEASRDDLNLKGFFNDMSLIGRQLRKPGLNKPNFNFADSGVTNYLLWLILAELKMLNDNVIEDA